MQKTENYGLALYEKEDKMSITDEENSLNSNMKIIDNALKEKATVGDIPTVPTKVSELTNDKGFISSIPSEYVTETELSAKGYLTSIPSEYITETELNNKKYLTSVPSTYKTKTENDSLYQAKGNYLTSYTETDPTVPSHVKSIKATDISNWNSKSTFSGSYNDLTNKPTIPSKVSQLENDKNYLTNIPSEYITETELSGKNFATITDMTSYLEEHKDELKGEKGDAGKDGTVSFEELTEEQKASLKGEDGKTPVKGEDYWNDDDQKEIEAYVASELAKRGQLKPEFANSADECSDPSKLYVLPDGYIYAYMRGDGYTNLVPTSTDTDGNVFNGMGYQDGYCLAYAESGATLTAQSGYTVTGFIPYKHTDLIRMSGVTWSSANKSCITFYDANKKPLANYIGNGYTNPAKATYTSEGILVNCLESKEKQSVTTANGVTTFNMDFVDKDTTNTSGGASGRAGYHIKYVRISAQGNGADMVITVNEEIVEGQESDYSWKSTNRAFVPADYEDRIVELEGEVEELQQEVNDIIEGNTAIAALSKFDPTEYGLPVLKITGDTSAMTKNDAVTLTYEYQKLSGTCDVKWQGSSSIKWPKKNYTIKFDKEFEAHTGWGAQKKYCLKANYIDFSHARNIVNAKLWGQIVKSRKKANEDFNKLVNAGAVDGFPICMFINDEYQGLYTFNIPKDGWLFGMKDNPNQAVVCAGGADDTSAVRFRKADVVLDTDFDLEYTLDENNTGWIKTSLDTMIAACINSNGTDLDTTLAELLDWDSVIDYIIFTTLQNGFDGLFKNYLLATYNGSKWYFSAYDMDSTYGLYWDGTCFVKTNEPYNNRASIGEFCRLNRAMELVKLYKKDELKARYAELRADILSEDNVATEFNNFIGSIPKALYDKECTIWKSLPSTSTNNVHQILDFYRKKCIAIDTEINSL
jgi:hypothetical protein